MHRLFSSPRVCIAGFSQAFVAGARIRLAPEQRHRLETVMRCRKGDLVRLFDGCSTSEWCGLLQDGHVVLDSPIPRSKHNEGRLTMIAFGRLANKDAMREVISAGVQLGVDILLPVISERCQRSSSTRSASKEATADEVVLQQYLTACSHHPLAQSFGRSFVADSSWPLAPAKAAAAIVEACEQSERWNLPLLLPAVPLSRFAEAWAGRNSAAPGGVQAPSAPSSKLHHKLASETSPPALPGLFPRLQGLSHLSCAVRHAAVAHESAADARQVPAASQSQQAPVKTAVSPQALFESVSSWRQRTAVQTRAAVAGISNTADGTARKHEGPHADAPSPPPTLPLLAVVVGPEGGWGPADEPALASLVASSHTYNVSNVNGLQRDDGSRSGAFVSLGRNVLRAETAALAALAVANAALE